MRMRRSRFAVAVLLLACCLGAAPALRADPVWRPLGPDGGTVTALAVDPTNPRVVYAGTPRIGVFKSVDSGATWAWSGFGLDAERRFRAVDALAVDPRRPATVFAALSDSVFRSTDGGATWYPAVNGLPRYAVSSLVIDPRPGGAVYAGTPVGVYSSPDRGASWQARGVPQPVTSLAFDAAGGVLLAGLQDGSVLRSTNGGAAWTAGRGLPKAIARALVFDPRRPGTAIAGVGGGIFRSTDSGLTWKLARLFKSPVVALAAQPSRRLLYAAVAGLAGGRGLYASANDGATWALTPQQPSDPDLHALAAGPAFVYTGTESRDRLGGIFRSADGGAAWALSVSGFSTLSIPSLAVDPADPGTLFAAAGALGLFRSTDRGGHWKLLDLPAALRSISDVFIEPARPSTVYVTDPFLRSDDGGETWQRPSSLPQGVRIVRVADDPRAPGALWAAALGGVFHTDDSGDTWRQVAVDPAGFFLNVRDVRPDLRDPQVVWAAGNVVLDVPGQMAPRLYRSADGGQTWERRDAGLSNQRYALADFAQSPSTPRILFAALGNGLYRSTDEGIIWNPVIPLGPIVTQAVTVTPTAVWAGLWPLGPYRSLNNGAFWTYERQGLTGRSIWRFIPDPADPEHLYAGTDTGGAFELTNP